MYSAARSSRFGIVHSPLVELSGVGGGRELTRGVSVTVDPGGGKGPRPAAAAAAAVLAFDVVWPVYV